MSADRVQKPRDASEDDASTNGGSNMHPSYEHDTQGDGEREYPHCNRLKQCRTPPHVRTQALHTYGRSVPNTTEHDM
jgi:hypothetical protein